MGDGKSVNRRTKSQTANLEQELNDNQESSSIKEFLDKRIAIMTVANCYLWVTLCVIYYGISLSSTSLAGNPFHNNGKFLKDVHELSITCLALSGSAESIAAIIAAVFVNKISRRKYVFWSMIASGLSLILLSALSAQYPIAENPWMEVTYPPGSCL